jgi:hypothetical protein
MTPLDRAAFRQWLAGKIKPKDLAGFRGSDRMCPLALFYMETTGRKRVRVGGIMWLPNGRRAFAEPLPDWAQDFVAGVDDVTKSPVILAAEALALLDSIPGGDAWPTNCC